MTIHEILRLHPRVFIKKLLLGSTENPLAQMVRYGMISVIALGFDVGAFTFCLLVLHTHIIVASSAGFLLGLAVSYGIAVRWAFSHRTYSRHLEMIGTLVIGLIGLGLTNGIIWVLAVPLHTDAFVAKAITVVVVFFWNFGARKVFLFSKDPVFKRKQNPVVSATQAPKSSKIVL